MSLRRIGGFRVGPTSLSYAPDGKSIATAGSWSRSPRIWDVATGREAFAQPGHVMGISTLAVSPADGTIFTGSYDGTVRAPGPDHRTRAGRDRPVQLRVDAGRRSRWPDPHRGRSVRRPGALERARAPRDPPLRRPAEGTLRHCAYSPDGRTVAFDRKIWDAASGKLLKVLHAPDERDGYAPTSKMFYTSDGKRLITAERGITARGSWRQERRLVRPFGVKNS